jgi:hypothetical protein
MVQVLFERSRRAGLIVGGELQVDDLPLQPQRLAGFISIARR